MKIKIRGYIHKDYFKEIELKDTKSKEYTDFWLPKRGIMVWDKRWSDDDVEVILEMGQATKNSLVLFWGLG